MLWRLRNASNQPMDHQCLEIIHPIVFNHLQGLVLQDTARNKNVSRMSTSKPLVDSLIDELTITNDPGWSFLGGNLVLKDRCNDLTLVLVPVDNSAKRDTIFVRANSHSHAIGQVLQCFCLLSQGFLNVFYFFSHCSIKVHAHARWISSLHVVAECWRCTILGTRGHSILRRNTQGNFERSVKNKTINIQGWGCLLKGGAFVWQSQVYVYKWFKVRRCSFRRGVRSSRFHCMSK